MKKEILEVLNKFTEATMNYEDSIPQNNIEKVAEELDALFAKRIVIRQSEQLAEHEHQYIINADWTYLSCECGKKIYLTANCL